VTNFIKIDNLYFSARHQFRASASEELQLRVFFRNETGLKTQANFNSANFFNIGVVYKTSALHEIN